MTPDFTTSVDVATYRITDRMSAEQAQTQEDFIRAAKEGGSLISETLAEMDAEAAARLSLPA